MTHHCVDTEFHVLFAMQLPGQQSLFAAEPAPEWQISGCGAAA